MYLKHVFVQIYIHATLYFGFSRRCQILSKTHKALLLLFYVANVHIDLPTC